MRTPDAMRLEASAVIVAKTLYEQALYTYRLEGWVTFDDMPAVYRDELLVHARRMVLAMGNGLSPARAAAPSTPPAQES